MRETEEGKRGNETGRDRGMNDKDNERADYAKGEEWPSCTRYPISVRAIWKTRKPLRESVSPKTTTRSGSGHWTVIDHMHAHRHH